MTPQLPDDEFRNPDGSAGTWLEPVSIERRRLAFWKRTVGGAAIAAALWAVQYSNNALDLDRGWIGLIPLGLGLLFGSAAYGATQARQYSSTPVTYTQRQRLMRAAKYWGAAAAVLGLIWLLQWQGGHLAQWWMALPPAALPATVGTGLYLLRSENVLTPGGAKAKAHYDKLAQQGDLGLPKQEPNAVERFLASRPVRYAAAAASLFGAYYFAFESGARNTGVGALAFVVLAAALAWEAALWMLGISLVIGIGYAVISGIASLPVSVAIIIGAIIIASAINR